MTDPDSDLVNTPGGPRKRDMLHAVAPGMAVQRAVGGSFAEVPVAHLLSPRLKAMLDSGSYIVTPGGPRRRELVHVLQPDEVVTKSGGNLKKINLLSDTVSEIVSAETLGLEQPGFGSGWITDASWINTNGVISAMTTTWIVPTKPKAQSGQLVYLFNGLQDNPVTQILQPVLQWGVSPDGGGPVWSIASWFVDSSGHAFKSPSVNVNEGDTLTGVMTLTAQSDQGFNYSCEFAGINNTTLRALGLNQLVMPVETLECYGIQSCSDYPDTLKTTMRAIDIKTAQGSVVSNFTAENRVTDCGQATKVVSNVLGAGEVDLYYRPTAVGSS